MIINFRLDVLFDYNELEVKPESFDFISGTMAAQLLLMGEFTRDRAFGDHLNKYRQAEGKIN